MTTEQPEIEVTVDPSSKTSGHSVDPDVTINGVDDVDEKNVEGLSDDPPMPTFGKVFGLARPEWPALVLGFCLMIAGEAAGMIPPLVLARAYDIVVSVEDPSVQREVVREKMLTVFAIFMSGQLAGWLRGSIMAIAGERVVARLRTRLFSAILQQEIGYFDKTKSGSLVSRLTSDTVVVQTVTTSSLPEMLLGLIKVIVAMVLMFIISVKLSGLVLTIAFGLFLATIPFGKWVGKISKNYQDALAAAQGVSTEALGAMRTVRAFVAEEKEANRYKKKVGTTTETTCWFPRTETDTTLRWGFISAMGKTSFMTFIFGIGFGAMYGALWMGFDLVINGELDFGMFMAFQSYIFQIGFGLASLGGHTVKVLEVKGASARIFELLERVPMIQPKPENELKELPKKLKGEVRFDNVEFQYPTRPDVDVLVDFNLDVPMNSTCALVGASGSGKSTVVRLLQRFYDVTGGRILVDGIDIRDVHPDALRCHLGFVQQEPVLFGLTVKENVVYGCKREVTDEEIERACRQANAHEFIEEFPDKYNTLVGERGVRLSGGQKQRVCIARALLVDPRILLLDEATSALDAESEHLVQSAINKLMVGRTTIIVAHRLSTVRNADQIVVIDNHAIVDVGKHNELLQRCEKYKELVKRQTDQPRTPRTPSMRSMRRERSASSRRASGEATRGEGAAPAYREEGAAPGGGRSAVI